MSDSGVLIIYSGVRSWLNATLEPNKHGRRYFVTRPRRRKPGESVVYWNGRGRKPKADHVIYAGWEVHHRMKY